MSNEKNPNSTNTSAEQSEKTDSSWPVTFDEVRLEQLRAFGKTSPDEKVAWLWETLLLVTKLRKPG